MCRGQKATLAAFWNVKMAVGKWCKGGEGRGGERARYEICAVFRAFTQTRFSLMCRTRATLGRAVIISFGNQREILSLSFFLFFFGLKIYVHVGRVKINFSQKIDTWDRFAFVREYRKMFDEFDEFFSYFFNISFRRVFFDSMFFEISRWNSGCIFIENEDVLYGFVDLSTRNALSSLIKKFVDL